MHWAKSRRIGLAPPSGGASLDVLTGGGKYPTCWTPTSPPRTCNLLFMTPVTESEIRAAVHKAVEENQVESKLVVDEFVVGERGRIDIAVIGDHLFGYELKSDLDSLARLPHQMNVFGNVFQYCTLVVTPRHLTTARKALRRNWGLAVVERADDERLIYRQVRTPKKISTVQNRSLVELLWRDETLRALDSIGLADGFRTKAKHVLWERLASHVTLEQLQDIVTQSLTARQGWRAVQEPHEYVAIPQPSGESSRFLARRLR